MKRASLQVIWKILTGKYKNYVLLNIGNPGDYTGINPEILNINGKYVNLDREHVLDICKIILDSNNKQK